MEFGLFSESGARRNPSPTWTYNEDIAEIITADQVGFTEVWVAERGSRSRGQSPDIVSAANLLIVAAARETRRIKLGTGIKPLPYHHPFTVATEANMCDHLTGGRYMLGYGGTHGMYGDHNKQLGLDGKDQRAMVYEAIEYIMRCFTEPEAFDFAGDFYTGKGINVLPKSVQKPHVPVGAACSGALPTLEVAAKNDFMPLCGRGGDPAYRIKEMADTYMASGRAAGRSPSRKKVRAAHHVYVARTVQQAKDELRSTVEPWIEEHKRSEHWESLGRWVPEGATLDDLTFDFLVDAGYYIVGDPDTVCSYIDDFYEAAGGFGTMLLITAQGHTSPELWHRSLRLFAEEVAPRLAHLDADADEERLSALAGPTHAGLRRPSGGLDPDRGG